jgi:hypothetical protein
MKNFFSAIITIFIVVFIVVIYYTIRDLWQRKVIEGMKIKIREKRYNDQKYYLQTYLDHNLSRLVNEELFWILVYVKKYPYHKVQLIYDKMSGNINIMTNSEKLDKKVIDSLIKLGITQFLKDNELYILSTVINSGIINEIIFFIFTTIYNQKSNLNLKIKTS